MEIIKHNEQKFTHETNATWGDLENARYEIESKEQQLFNISISKQTKESIEHLDPTITNNYEQCDFDGDLQHFQTTRNMKLNNNRPYQTVKQPHKWIIQISLTVEDN